MKEHLAEKCDLLSKTGVSVKELTEMRLLVEQSKRSIIEKDAELRKIKATLTSEIEQLITEKKVAVEEATVTLAGEVCLLRDMYIAK